MDEALSANGPDLPNSHVSRTDSVADEEIRRGKILSFWPELVFFALLGFLLFWRLGHYGFWSDEGETALLGKMILRTGLPTAYDGRNLYEFYGGMMLTPRFVNVYSPWLQYYVAAAAFWLFGPGEWQGRVLFVLAAFAGAVLLWDFARRVFDRRTALVMLVSTACNVEFILMARQCRYYGVLILLTAALLWCWQRFDGRRWWHAVVTGSIMLLFFFANPMSGMAALAGVFGAGFFLLDKRRALRLAVIPAPLVLVCVGAFMVWQRRSGAPPPDMLFPNARPWPATRIFLLHIKDFDLLGLLPAGVIVLAGALMIFARKRTIRRRQNADEASLAENLSRGRRELFLLVGAVIFTIVLSIVTIQPWRNDYAEIRYALPAFCLLLVLQGSLLSRLIAWNRIAGIAVLVLASTTNLLTFDCWRGLLSKERPRSLLVEYIKENAEPFPNATNRAVELLRKYTAQDDTVLVTPNYMYATVMYYFSDKLLLHGALSPTNKTLLPLHPELPRRHFSVTDPLPKWVIRFSNASGEREQHTERFVEELDLPKNYHLISSAGFGRNESRPEIWYRNFEQRRLFAPFAALQLWRRNEE